MSAETCLIDFISRSIFALNSSLGASLIVAVVAFLLTAWYNKQNKRREASIIVAEVLAEWANLGGKELSSEDILPLHKAYWKAALLLDPELLIMLNKRLQNTETCSSAKKVLEQARMVLQGRSTPDILENDFIHWTPSKKNDQLQDITKAVREATEPLKAELQALKDTVADQEAQIKALETQRDFEKK